MAELSDKYAARVAVGYQPWVVEEAWDGGQLLVQVFIDDDGMMIVRVARRDHIFDTWGVPLEAKHG